MVNSCMVCYPLSDIFLPGCCFAKQVHLAFLYFCQFPSLGKMSDPRVRRNVSAHGPHAISRSPGAYNHHLGGGLLHPSRRSPLIHDTEFAAATSTQPRPHLPSAASAASAGDSGASVNSDYSSGGNSCSTAGGGDRSPPYLPRRTNGRVSICAWSIPQIRGIVNCCQK